MKIFRLILAGSLKISALNFSVFFNKLKAKKKVNRPPVSD